MFQSLRSICLSLMVVAAGAVPARAVVDVDHIRLLVTIARSSLVADAITAELRVVGTDLQDGKVTKPGATQAVALKKDGADLVLGDTFASETELNAAFPNGDYVLRFNNDTTEVTVSYSRPAVPSPAISQPQAGEILPPGPLEVLFASCPICIQAGDSVEAVLEDDAKHVLAHEVLTASSTSWKPDDGMGGDLSLAPNSKFVARVAHTALRQSSPTIDDADDLVLFSASFTQSDELDFETGFEAPSGTVCVSVNHPAPPAGCASYANPLLSILDPSGAFTTQIQGHDVDVAFSVGPSGALSGVASADLDGDGNKDAGPSPIKGKLGGSAEERRSRLAVKLVSSAPPAKLKLRVTDEFLLGSDVQNRIVRASGKLSGVKVREETPSSVSPIPAPLLGWYVQLDVDSSGSVQNAVLTLEGGETFTLAGRNKFDFRNDESAINLASDVKGIRIQLRKLLLDESTAPLGVDGGTLKFKILGQSGRTPLQ